MLVGHVTKDGSIAGPRVLEHMVDTVLGFEGERSHQYRILRAVKNRFGGTDEIGVFAMEGGGLAEVPNPSALFLTQRGEPVSGTGVFPALEGTRPVLVEIQALTVRLASGATPRRAAVGWDSGRLAMILAVLEARCGLSFATAEVYLNVAGGYRLQRSRRRPGGGGGAGLGAVRAAGAGGSGGDGRGRAVGRGAAGRACRAAAQGSGQARLRARRGCRRAPKAPSGHQALDPLRQAARAGRPDLLGRVDCALATTRAHGSPSLADATMTALDIFVLLLLGGGALVGFVRGFVA